MAGLLAAYAPAWGTSVILNNSSFENLPAGGLSSTSSMGDYEEGSVPGWIGRGFSAAGAGGTAGWYGEWAATTTLNSVPNGSNVAFVTNAEIYQDVGPAMADTTYTLSVDVGARTDVAFGGSVALWINGAQYLATETAITPGNWSTWSVTYTTTNPDVGAQLYIQLMDVEQSGTYNQAEFDNVALTADDPVPEPGTAALSGVFLAGLAFYRRRTIRRNRAGAPGCPEA